MKQADSMAKGQREWIPLLDAIRGLAVLGVVLCHSYWASRIAHLYDQSWLRPLGLFFAFGNSIRVPLLFCLSGFLMVTIIEKYTATNSVLREFLSRRLVRLYPTWLIAIGLSFLMTIFIAVLNHQELPHWTPAKLFANLTFTPFIVDEEAEIGVAWTLFIEFQLYIVFGIVFKIAGWFHKLERSKVLFWMLFTTSLLSYFVPDYTIGNVWFHPHWKWFSLGAIVSISVSQNLYRPLPSILCLLMMTMLLQSGFQSYEIPQSLLLVSVAILALTQPSAKVWQQGQSFRNLAKVSYAWFLTHILIVRHSHYIQVVLTKLHIPVPVTYFLVVLLSLLVAIAITPLMNRVDKLLMSILFPRKAASGK